jgi:hypothetical protein
VLAADHNNPQRPEWPSAEFIVGNPPFVGKGELMRLAFGQAYLDALWTANPSMNQSADFVMYWWDRAADIIVRKGTVLRRFGFVTTNSITQVFNRRVVERHLKARTPISIVMAIPDHPWTKATKDAAAVRIAMTVGEAGTRQGQLREILRELALDTDTPYIELSERQGTINSDLTVGVDVTSAVPLHANEGLASMGPALGGRGFVVTLAEAEHLGGNKNSQWLKLLTTGKDITENHRNRYVIDVREYDDEDTLRNELPKVYQHLRASVWPERQKNNDPKLRQFWWRFRRSNETYFNAVSGLVRFIASVETTKHRTFVFVSGNELLEHGVVGFGLDDAWLLGALSSRIHVAWTLANGDTLEDRPRYNKDVCFDTFPFPATDELKKQRIRILADELDKQRKRAIALHPHLTLTDIYNVIEKVRAGMTTDALDPGDKRIFDDGLVLVIRELHDKLDAAVADAYGWPADIGENEILAKLVTLNKERAQEEARGLIRWLRPEYQGPRFGLPKEREELDLVGVAVGQVGEAAALPKASFPAEDVAQTAAVMAVLAAAGGPQDAVSIASRFRQGRRNLRKVEAVLAALARMGFVATTDGGRSFALRRTG